MQIQPPDQNNPANPLFKVSALSVDRCYPEPSKPDEIAVPVSLNFKQSRDMRGQAKTVDGHDVNVAFSLALSRASFDLSFHVEGAFDEASIVEVKKVAFQTPLSATGQFKDVYSKSTQLSSVASASLSAGTKASIANIDPAAKISATAGKKRSSSRTRNTTYTINFPCSNIKVTSAGHRINWEIVPKNVKDDLARPDLFKYLEGEMFPNGEKDETSCACFIRRKAGYRNNALIIMATVSTSLKDMIVNDIEFSDDLGNEVSWKDIKSESDSCPSLSETIFKANDVKKSLLKSVIRKHLVSQGMKAHGSLVEISKAYT